MTEEKDQQSYAAGDRVEVYDEDRGHWCAGTVETYGRTPMGLMYAVRADDEFENELPVVFGIIADHEAQLMRPLVVDAEDGGDGSA